jgi:hypothetical protein
LKKKKKLGSGNFGRAYLVEFSKENCLRCLKIINEKGFRKEEWETTDKLV